MRSDLAEASLYCPLAAVMATTGIAETERLRTLKRRAALPPALQDAASVLDDCTRDTVGPLITQAGDGLWGAFGSLCV